MAATHLIHHSFGYIFRYCIPPDIQPLIQKREFRYSLKTGSLRCAKARARAMAGYVSVVINKIRDNDFAGIAATQINSHIRDRFKEITGYASTIRHPVRPSFSLVSGSVVSGPQLTDVLKRHVADAKAGQQWSPKTTQEVISGIELFIRMAGICASNQD